ncbi:MAG: DUF3795 domain-containing protein [Promethearchaeota archaeon]
MSDVKKELLAPCGLYCGVCRIYKAYKNNDLDFKKNILPTLNEYGAKTIDDVACTGCLSDGIVFHFCKNCPIKECIKNKKIEGCHLCDDFPCTIVTDWPDSLDKKIMLRSIPVRREIGSEKWVEEEEKRYKCPKCGNSLFYGAKKCYRCNIKVDLD